MLLTVASSSFPSLRSSLLLPFVRFKEWKSSKFGARIGQRWDAGGNRAVRLRPKGGAVLCADAVRAFKTISKARWIAQ